MSRILLCLSLLLSPAVLQAQGWDWSKAQFGGLYSGVTPRFHDPDKPRLAPDGSVRRPSDPGSREVQFGTFTLLPDGRLCIAGSEGGDGCGLYMRDGTMRMLVTQGGKRLPFKFELGLGN